MAYPNPVPIPRRRTSLLGAGAGGFLAHLAFPQASIWPLAIVGMALLMWSVGRDSARWAFLVGTVWGIGHFLPLLWWAHAAVGFVPWIALSIAQGLIMGLAPAAYVWIRRTTPWRNAHLALALPFAAAWTAAEQLRHQWPFGGFPWVRLAFSQTDGPLVKLAPFGGAPLVSFAVAFLGAVVAIGITAMRAADIVRIPAAVLIVALGLLAPMLIGLDVRPETGTVRVGAVQGNIANPGLNAFENAREVTTNHMEGTTRLLDKHGQVDMVLWPENASDYDPRDDEEARAMVNHAAESAGVPVLVGTVRYVDDTRYNEVVVWEGTDTVGDVYAKQVPAAFAEYIPMRSWLRTIVPVVDMVSVDMSPGQEPAFVDVEVASLDRTVRTATIICFEVAYDWLVQDSVHSGAEFLYVPTNNASFGRTAESDQQLAMTRFRAIEHGRAAVQISTVGVSGFISPDGTQHSVTELFTPAEFAANVPLRTSQTWSARLGQWPVGVLGAVVTLGVIAGMVSYRVPVRR